MHGDHVLRERLEVAGAEESRSVVPVHSESTFGAPMPSARSSRLTVRKSMLKRVLLVVFGTVECNWAAEKTRVPPGGVTTRTRVELEWLLRPEVAFASPS